MHSTVKDFYSEKSVFITGGTGFLGKVLIEKLLRSCPHISTIYVLIRSRQHKSAEERLEEEILNSSAFNNKNKHKLKVQKLVAIDGDLTKPGLALSPEDRQTLISNVSVVFHSAAAVKFHGPLKGFLEQNVFGTDSVMKLCNEMSKLEALVYVSTAYSNCNITEIEEKVYKLEESAVNTIKKLSKDIKSNYELDRSLTPLIMEGRPNAYTYSKAIAENLVNEQYSHLPVVMVRPSIVTSSVKEPSPGWIDNVNGVAGAFLLGGIGIARTMDVQCDAKADIIPVDIICNSLIVIGWHSATHPNERKQVIHLTTGDKNPITWGKLLDHARDSAIENPSMRTVRPVAKNPTSRKGVVGRINHLVTKYFSHILFAYLADIILTLLGYKRFMVRIIEKLHRAFAVLEPFTTKEWLFLSHNYYLIYEKLSEEDRNTFFSDVRDINWKSYGENLFLGIRRYLLKESDATVEKAKQRMTYINLIHTLFQIFFTTLLIYFVFILFS